MTILPYGKQELVVNFAGPQVTKTFTGKELDLYNGESVSGEDGEGRYYFGARYYDQEIGLWISCDPNEQFYNSYAYAANGTNPITFVDDDGRVLNFIVGAASGVAIGWGIATLTGQDYTMADAVIDAGTGAIGLGVFSKLKTIGKLGIEAYRAEKAAKLIGSNMKIKMAEKSMSALKTEVTKTVEILAPAATLKAGGKAFLDNVASAAGLKDQKAGTTMTTGGSSSDHTSTTKVMDDKTK